MDLERMIETLKSGGASQAEIDQVVESYTQNKYQPQPVSLQPAFYLESDQCVQLGRESHAVRLLNVDDLRRLLPKMVEMIRYLLQEQGSKQKVEEVLDQTSPLGVVGVLVQKLIEMNLKGDYPDWFVSLLEEIAHLASNEKQQLSPQFLISLPPSQFSALILKIVEVNQQDFLTLWASVPPGIRLTISTLASRLTSAWKNLSRNLTQLEASSGGAASTGKSSSSSRSAKKPVSAKAKSAVAV
ncbi:MAG: hypothetical protein ACO1RX_08420 [Candidatus Sericytochromatia bacterium]